ncbi:MAG: CoA pyrophosphatase [Candidatus Caldarchaeum sp.]|nr:CoA pyrophosphatase [Candidatus Caldarchaeum sp.]MDW7978622.1 CoA pyrophosphatase [Candidatus Caldarchaeum sp.]MDW8360127.1 CoA pyrophosphatase [Candidatus Caldarchaeum sp.]
MESRLREGLAPIRAESLEPGRSYAAVCILLRKISERPEVLLVKRAERSTDPWSGHIAFPGGRYKASDSDLVETALRELEEETGIRRDVVRLVGALPFTTPANSPDLLVKPYVALLLREAEVHKGSEVQKVLWVPLRDLKIVATEVYSKYSGAVRKHLCYVYGDELIWGMTFKLIRRVLQVLGL